MHAPDGELRVAAIGADGPDLPPSAALGPGPYRVRAHARGRDTGRALRGTGEMVEDYLFQIWPAPPAPEIIHKQTDAYGAVLRRSAARQPHPGH
ncbi:hypothetical protein ACFY4C_01785 [Actinomadura viridis]|uniref:hypothetical protein n=1 Tax=Actinomadura viridis TaxID=58110 RepID=UPI00367F58D4